MSSYDKIKNFAKSTLAGDIDSTTTSLNLQSGDGAKFPDVEFNCVIWKKSSYAEPDDDPNMEIVRVTSKGTGDNWTIVRAQEGTSAHAHQSGDRIELNITAKVIQDLIDNKADGASSSTDNAIARFDGTTGKVIQNSAVTIDDNGNVSGVGTLVTSNDLTIWKSTNDGNPKIRIGSGSSNQGIIRAFYDSGAQTLNYLIIGVQSETEGDLVLQPDGNVGVGTVDPDKLFHVEESFASTNTVERSIRFTRLTDDEPAAGIGVGIEFELETAIGHNEIVGSIDFVTTDISNGSEDADFVVNLMAGGTTAAEKFRVTSAGEAQMSSAKIGSLSGVLKASSGVVSGGATQDDLPDGTTYKQYNPANVAITGGTIDGISVSNLVDKTADETITGPKWTFNYNSSDIYKQEISAYFTLITAYNSIGSGEPRIAFSRSLGTLSSPTVITGSNVNLGGIFWHSYVGSSSPAFERGAVIMAFTDGNCDDGSTPTRLEFKTSPSGSATPALALTIDSSQNATFEGQVNINSANGIDINPGSDQDTDLITVGVTGSPKIWWDESADKMIFSAKVDFPEKISGRYNLTSHSGDDRVDIQMRKTVDQSCTIYDHGVYFDSLLYLNSGVTQSGYSRGGFIRSLIGGYGNSYGNLSKQTGLCVHAASYANSGYTISGTVTTRKGLEICTDDGGSGTNNLSVTNKYGLYILDVSGGTSCNYAIYTGTGSVSFGDKLYVRGLTQQSAGGLTVEYDTTTKELYAETSGAKFKKNIKNLSLDPSNLLNLKLKSWIDKETGRPEFGYLADDLAEIYPQAVVFAPDFKKVVKTKEQKIKHEDGTEEVIPAEYEEVPIEGTEKPVGIKMTKLPILAIELIKKQQKEIEALKKKIKALEK